MPGSVVTLKQTELALRHGLGQAQVAQAELVAQVKSNARGEAALIVKGAAITPAGTTAPPVVVETFAAALESSSADTTADWSITGAELRELRAKVADWRSFDTYLRRAGPQLARGPGYRLMAFRNNAAARAFATSGDRIPAKPGIGRTGSQCGRRTFWRMRRGGTLNRRVTFWASECSGGARHAAIAMLQCFIRALIA